MSVQAQPDSAKSPERHLDSRGTPSNHSPESISLVKHQNLTLPSTSSVPVVSTNVEFSSPLPAVQVPLVASLSTQPINTTHSNLSTTPSSSTSHTSSPLSQPTLYSPDTPRVPGLPTSSHEFYGDDGLDNDILSLVEQIELAASQSSSDLDHFPHSPTSSVFFGKPSTTGMSLSPRSSHPISIGVTRTSLRPFTPIHSGQESTAPLSLYYSTANTSSSMPKFSSFPHHFPNTISDSPQLGAYSSQGSIRTNNTNNSHLTPTLLTAISRENVYGSNSSLPPYGGTSPISINDPFYNSALGFSTQMSPEGSPINSTSTVVAATNSSGGSSGNINNNNNSNGIHKKPMSSPMESPLGASSASSQQLFISSPQLNITSQLSNSLQNTPPLYSPIHINSNTNGTSVVGSTSSSITNPSSPTPRRTKKSKRRLSASSSSSAKQRQQQANNNTTTTTSNIAAPTTSISSSTTSLGNNRTRFEFLLGIELPVDVPYLTSTIDSTPRGLSSSSIKYMPSSPSHEMSLSSSTSAISHSKKDKAQHRKDKSAGGAIMSSKKKDKSKSSTPINLTSGDSGKEEGSPILGRLQRRDSYASISSAEGSPPLFRELNLSDLDRGEHVHMPLSSRSRENKSEGLGTFIITGGSASATTSPITSPRRKPRRLSSSSSTSFQKSISHVTSVTMPTHLLMSALKQQEVEQQILDNQQALQNQSTEINSSNNPTDNSDNSTTGTTVIACPTPISSPITLIRASSPTIRDSSPKQLRQNRKNKRDNNKSSNEDEIDVHTFQSEQGSAELSSSITDSSNTERAEPILITKHHRGHKTNNTSSESSSTLSEKSTSNPKSIPPRGENSSPSPTSQDQQQEHSGDVVKKSVSKSIKKRDSFSSSSSTSSSTTLKSSSSPVLINNGTHVSGEFAAPIIPRLPTTDLARSRFDAAQPQPTSRTIRLTSLAAFESIDFLPEDDFSNVQTSALPSIFEGITEGSTIDHSSSSSSTSSQKSAIQLNIGLITRKGGVSTVAGGSDELEDELSSSDEYPSSSGTFKQTAPPASTLQKSSMNTSLEPSYHKMGNSSSSISTYAESIISNGDGGSISNANYVSGVGAGVSPASAISSVLSTGQYTATPTTASGGSSSGGTEIFVSKKTSTISTSLPVSSFLSKEEKFTSHVDKPNNNSHVIGFTTGDQPETPVLKQVIGISSPTLHHSASSSSSLATRSKSKSKNNHNKSPNKSRGREEIPIITTPSSIIKSKSSSGGSGKKKPSSFSIPKLTSFSSRGSGGKLTDDEGISSDADDFIVPLSPKHPKYEDEGPPVWTSPKSSADKLAIRHGTVLMLIRQLTRHTLDYVDHNKYQLHFLIAFRRFISPLQLFVELTREYSRPPVLNNSTGKSNSGNGVSSHPSSPITSPRLAVQPDSTDFSSSLNEIADSNTSTNYNSDFTILTDVTLASELITDATAASMTDDSELSEFMATPRKPNIVQVTSGKPSQHQQQQQQQNHGQQSQPYSHLVFDLSSSPPLTLRECSTLSSSPETTSTSTNSQPLNQTQHISTPSTNSLIVSSDAVIQPNNNNNSVEPKSSIADDEEATQQQPQQLSQKTNISSSPPPFPTRITINNSSTNNPKPDTIPEVITSIGGGNSNNNLLFPLSSSTTSLSSSTSSVKNKQHQLAQQLYQQQQQLGLSSSQHYLQLQQHHYFPSRTLSSKALEVMRDRIVSIFCQWLILSPTDFFQDEILSVAVQIFVEKVVAEISLDHAYRINRSWEQSRELWLSDYRKNQSLKDILPLPKGKLDIDMSNTDIKLIANELTMITVDLMRPLAMMDYWEYAVASAEEKSQPTVDGVIRVWKLVCLFNTICTWTSTELLKRTQLSSRTKVLKQFMKLVITLTDMHNFESASAVASALDSAAIYRLRNTWKGIKPKLMAKYQQCVRLFSPDDNSKAYRQLCLTVEPPALPLIGLILKDLTFLQDGLQDFVPFAPVPLKVVNFSKWAGLAATVWETRRLQPTRYDLKRHPIFRRYLDEFEPFPEKVAFNMSKVIEPRSKSDSNSSLISSSSREAMSASIISHKPILHHSSHNSSSENISSKSDLIITHLPNAEISITHAALYQTTFSPQAFLDDDDDE